MTERFTNFANVIGKVDDFGWNDNVGDGKTMGNLNIKVNDDTIFVNLFNPRKAKEDGRNVVSNFFNKIEEGNNIQLRGNIQERKWEGEYRRQISPFISGKKGVTSYNILPDDTTMMHKATLAFEGDVLEKELRFDALERFSGKNTAITELTVAYFNTYNPDGDGELDRQAVLNRELQNYYKYNKENNNDFADLDQVKKWGKTVEEDGAIETVHNVLKQFYKSEEPRMFNIDILHLVAYSVVESDDDLAEKLAEEIDVYDNVALGCIISNKMNVDEFGFTDGVVNELEIKKFKGINNKYNESSEGFNTTDDNDDNDGWNI